MLVDLWNAPAATAILAVVVFTEVVAVWWGWNVIVAEALDLYRHISVTEALALCALANLVIALWR